MKASRVSLTAGLLVLVLTVVSGIVARMVPCGGLPKTYAPILAFELARTPTDLVALFGAEPSACRDVLITTAHRATIGDYALYMPAYGLFLLAWFVALRARRPSLARAGIALAVIALVGDALENVCLFGILAQPVSESPALAWLPWATNVKWVALGAIGVLVAIAVGSRGVAGKIGARFALIAPLGVVASIVSPPLFGPLLALAVAVSWVVMLVVAGRDGFARSTT